MRLWSLVRWKPGTPTRFAYLAHLGYPLLGDPLYGGPRNAFPRQALHATRLGLVHPASGRDMKWDAPLPEDIAALLESLRGE